MPVQEFRDERFTVRFEVLLGRVLSSEQASERGRTRPIIFHLELRDEDGAVFVKTGSQSDIDLDADPETVEQQILAERDALIKSAKSQVVPLQAAREDERRAEEQIEQILAIPR